jgi:hypothetical protein
LGARGHPRYNRIVATLLPTKFYLPPKPVGVVERPQLLGKLDGVLTQRLTLVSAPAGTGRSLALHDHRPEWTGWHLVPGVLECTDPTVNFAPDRPVQLRSVLKINQLLMINTPQDNPVDFSLYK